MTQKKIAKKAAPKTKAKGKARTEDLPVEQTLLAPAYKFKPISEAPVVVKQENTSTKSNRALLKEKRRKVLDDLGAVEKQIYDLETRYLESTHPIGDALRGYNKILEGTPLVVQKITIKDAARHISRTSLTGDYRPIVKPTDNVPTPAAAAVQQKQTNG